MDRSRASGSVERLLDRLRGCGVEFKRIRIGAADFPESSFGVLAVPAAHGWLCQVRSSNIGARSGASTLGWGNLSALCGGVGGFLVINRRCAAIEI